MNFWYAIRPRSWIAYLLLPFSLLFWLWHHEILSSTGSRYRGG